MSDITYTAQGTFNSKRNAQINVCIPPEPASGKYKTEMYNLSKITSSGSINAIFCHFSNGNSEEMHHDSFDFKLNFEIGNLKHHPGAVDFDEFKEDALFIFFHNEEFEKIDRDMYFNNIEEKYNDVKHNGNQNQNGVISTTAALTNPRKVGLSLILKRSK